MLSCSVYFFKTSSGKPFPLSSRSGCIAETESAFETADESLNLLRVQKSTVELYHAIFDGEP